ncbi:MAG: GAF domain-containing protein [Planctomycetia bacterium]|nr:GAF domain-containing protein [Planctomycetia bacterium]
MHTPRRSESYLLPFPEPKRLFDPNDASYIGALPELLRVFQSTTGYDLKFLRAGSCEMATQDNPLAYDEAPEEFERLVNAQIAADANAQDNARDEAHVKYFPVAIADVKIFGSLRMKRSENEYPKVEWNDACKLAQAFAQLLADNHLWRQDAVARHGELAAQEAAMAHLYESISSEGVAARVRDVLRVGVHALGNFVAAELALLDQATTTLQTRVVWGLPQERLLEPPRPLRGARAEIEALLGSAVVINDASVADVWHTPEDFPCAICVPVCSDSTILGVLWLYSNSPQKIGTREAETLNLITGRLVDELLRGVYSLKLNQKEEQGDEEIDEDELDHWIQNLMREIK